MRLPCDGDLSSITTASDMPRLSEVFDTLGTNNLSAFAGHVITMSLYKRCHDHQQAALRNPLNPFWDSFYAIDKSITQCRKGTMFQGTNLRGQSPRPSRDASAGREAFSLVSSMNLAAADIKLRMTAIHKAAKEQLQSTLLTEAVATCMAASGDIVAALRAGRQLKWREREVFQYSNCMYAWALSTVVQMHLWMMVNTQAQPLRDNTPGGGGSYPSPSWSSHVDSLRFLAGATRELMSPEHIRPGLLEEVDKLVDQRERPPKRSHATLTA
jgi:hypothetical protein